MNQTNVAVIFGGVSSEHEISLRSATSVLQELDRTRYHIIMVGITRTAAGNITPPTAPPFWRRTPLSTACSAWTTANRL